MNKVHCNSNLVEFGDALFIALPVCYRTCFALPKKTAEGYVVLYQKVESSDVTKYNFDESCKLFFMTMDTLLRSEGSVPGIIFLLDYTNIRFGHLAKARIASIRTMFKYVQV